MFIETKGKQGEQCDMPEASQLLDLVHEWEKATSEDGRRKVWEKMLSINADQVFSIGTVNGIMTPVVVGPKVRNVPKEGYWAWDPGGYIGLYKPDTFWLTRKNSVVPTKRSARLRSGRRNHISGGGPAMPSACWP